MEILKHGTFADKKIITVCSECECKFKYDLRDCQQMDKAKKIHDGWLDRTIVYEHFVFCPECKAQLLISKDKVEIFERNGIK